MHELELHPVTMSVQRPDTKKSVTITLGQYDLQFQLSWAVTELDTDEWPSLATAIHEMARGDFQWLANRAVLWRLGKHRSLIEGKLSGIMMDCVAAPPMDSRLRSADKSEPFTPDFDYIPGTVGCNALANSVAPVHKPSDWKTVTVPTFIYNGEADVQTPVANARAALTHYPNGELVIIGGASHDLDEPSEFYEVLAGKAIRPGRVSIRESSASP